MSETLVPTARLRFIEKPEPVDGTGMVSTTRKIRVLQQQFYQPPSEHVVWIDVPLVTPMSDLRERAKNEQTVLGLSELLRLEKAHNERLQARLTEAERVIIEARANVGQLSSGCFREQWAADRGAAAWVVLDNYHETYLR